MRKLPVYMEDTERDLEVYASPAGVFLALEDGAPEIRIAMTPKTAQALAAQLIVLAEEIKG